MTHELSYVEFRQRLKEIIVSYLDSPEVSNARWMSEIGRLADTNYADNPTMQEAAERAAMFLSAIYQHYLSMYELLAGFTTPQTIEEKYKQREQQSQCMRYTKSMFRKGLQFGTMFS